MSSSIKNQKGILSKLSIDQLNPMQLDAQHAIHSNDEVVLLSPTGTGKTLAFLLPIISELDPKSEEVQALIIAPSRELAIQINQVTREMGTGYKINLVYGGRPFNKEKTDLKHAPAIVIGTPGRVADHLRRRSFSGDGVKTLVLDEFDKSLEIGFDGEMIDILEALPNVEKKILTSATQGVEIPDFVELKKPHYVDFSQDGVKQLQIKAIISPSKDKLETLVDALSHLGNHPGIIFCNFKNSIQRVSDYLTEKGISHGCFYGGMEQKERERALIKFRNGTHQLLLATDLAARGIDVPEIKFILHYHLPLRSQEFTHRNGRTARMNNEGTAYVLHWKQERLPDFIQNLPEETLQPAALPSPSKWKTLFISGGRKDKISKGDIAGLFFKIGQLKSDELGIIELKQDCAFVSVPAAKIEQLIELVNNHRLKKKKVRVMEI
ncbi:MAG: superfamily II DNA/RNA helicase [Paraglaciecola sp.]|jgi:superfamily II DNA/RNA helicase